MNGPSASPPAPPGRETAAALAGAGVAWGALSYVALTIGVLAEGYHYTLTGAAGLGWLAAGLNTSLSRSTQPERLFLTANFGCITIAAAFFYLMPMLYARTTQPVYFAAYGVLCLTCAAFMRWLPAASARPSAAAGARPRGRLARATLFSAVSLVWLCYAAVWSLVERLGSELGMSEEAIGRSMGFGTLSGLVGAGAAAWLAGRLRPLAPLILTSLASGACYLWLGFCRGGGEYTWLLCIWGVVFCPILAYAYAVGTQIDRSGALGRMIGGGTAIATALGPVVGAFLKTAMGFRGVGWVTFAGTVLACGAFALLAVRRRRA